MRAVLSLIDYVGYPPPTKTGRAARLTFMKLGGSPSMSKGNRPSCWIADITGGEWKFLRPALDYSAVNIEHGRNADKNYFLRPHRLYIIQESTSWCTTRRYLCTAIDGEVVKCPSVD
jgi:hypothetical protein